MGVKRAVDGNQKVSQGGQVKAQKKPREKRGVKGSRAKRKAELSKQVREGRCLRGLERKKPTGGGGKGRESHGAGGESKADQVPLVERTPGHPKERRSAVSGSCPLKGTRISPSR